MAPATPPRSEGEALALTECRRPNVTFSLGSYLQSQNAGQVQMLPFSTYPAGSEYPPGTKNSQGLGTCLEG